MTRFPGRHDKIPELYGSLYAIEEFTNFGNFVLAPISPALAQVSTSPVATPAQQLLRATRAPKSLQSLSPSAFFEGNVHRFQTAPTGAATRSPLFFHTSSKASWTVPTVNWQHNPKHLCRLLGRHRRMELQHREANRHNSDCSGSSPSYYAWYEFLPPPVVSLSPACLSLRHHMSASVTYSGTEFTITINHESTGKSYSKSSKSTGETVVGRMDCRSPLLPNGGGIWPLSDFAPSILATTYRC